MSNLTILVPAAGTGQRYGGACPKQYQEFAGRRLLDVTLAQLLQLPHRGPLWLGLASDDSCWQDCDHAYNDKVRMVVGSSTRAETVWNLLQAADTGQAGEDTAAHSDWVLIHDAVRPNFTLADLQPLLQRMDDAAIDGASLGRPLVEAVKRVGANGLVRSGEIREGLWLTQTPQLFRRAALREALQLAMRSHFYFDDEMMALHQAGFSTAMVDGPIYNIKITRPGDMELAVQLRSLMP